MSLQEVKDRIESLDNIKLQRIAKFQLLTACRLSEAVGKYAVRPTDLVLTQYKGFDLALWTLRTAKREGVERIIALPLKEQWVPEMIVYFQSRKNKVFDYGISSVQHLLRKELEGLQYFIERYTLKPKNIPILRHEREMCSHALRHIRLSELINVYGFDYQDLATFAGWKMSGIAGRYVTSAWGRYINKLLRV